jgi:hypothetical protein
MSIKSRRDIQRVEFPWASPDDPTIEDVQTAINRAGKDLKAKIILTKLRGPGGIMIVEFEAS